MELHLQKQTLLIFLNIMSLTLHASAATEGNQMNKLALLEFKSQLYDDPLGLLRSWNDSIDFCQWNGVTCDSNNQRVTGLVIRGMRLTGVISPHIGNLSLLTTLDLSENSFTGFIPPEFGRLTRLRNLNLSFNFIGGVIPVNISRCSNLVNLSLALNNLRDQIPLEIGSLHNLNRLFLGANQLTGLFPSTFGNLSSLQYLNLAFNNLQGEIPDAVARMRSLRIFSLGPNNISGIFPPAIYNLSSLQVLSLSTNNFYGELKRDIGLAFPNIQSFLLAQNKFIGKIPASFSNVSNLQLLDLPFNKFTGSIPLAFGNLKALSHLNVGANSLGDGKTDNLVFLTSLANCSSLEHLDFAANHFGGELPISIANLSTKLRWLNFYGNNIIGHIPADIANLASLTNLNMHTNFLTGTLPASLGTFSKLETLYLGENNFTGEIPFTLGNLSQLLLLDLSNNSLEGSITISFGNFKYLQTVLLSHNTLNGPIPKQLLGISSLSKGLNLSHNSFTGTLPEFGKLELLVAFDVSYNKLSGNITSTIGNCLALEQLYMQGNFFQGTIPNLGRSRGLQYLDLSSNNFHGEIPMYLANFSFLQNLNLSFNNLEGKVPAGGVFNISSAVELNGNSKLCGGPKELRLHTCPVQKAKATKKHIIIIIVVISCCFFLSVFILLLLFAKKANRKISSPASFRLFFPKVSYKELQKATDGFSPTKLIGTGSFGSVYEGTLGEDNKSIAVKVLNLQHQGASKSFKAECIALRNIRHRNLVRIITTCSSIDFEGNDFRALVYEFMPCGSLEQWLHPLKVLAQERTLTLVQRLSIAVDVASALNYLHHECQTPVVHCDLKPSNVLLDNDLTARVSDFGLARILSKLGEGTNPNEFSSLGIKGTIGYAAPEYGMGCEISTSGDVYSFGILLLELFTGRRPAEEAFRDSSNLHIFVQQSLPDKVIDILDQSALCNQVVGESTERARWSNHLTREQTESIISVFRIGVACSLENPRNRMNMSQVVEELVSIRYKYNRASSSSEDSGSSPAEGSFSSSPSPNFST